MPAFVKASVLEPELAGDCATKAAADATDAAMSDLASHLAASLSDIPRWIETRAMLL